MSASTVWISCGVVRPELEELHQRKKISGRLLFLDSMLHMNPEELEVALTSEAAGIRSGGHGPMVLVYGDCCGHMRELTRNFCARRIEAVNCAQLLLGRVRYRELMREKAYILFLEWAARWRTIFSVELGMSRKVARSFMREHHKALVYLDTGLAPVPRRALDECSDYVGLPWLTETVGLEHMLAGLLKAESEAPVSDRENRS